MQTFERNSCLLFRSPGYALFLQASRPESDIGSSVEQTSVGSREYVVPGGSSNLSFPLFPHSVFVPFQLDGASVNSGNRLGVDINIPDSQLEMQRKFLQHQIEVSFTICFLVLLLFF